jgi:RNA polymerase sigma-70 factor, ECF subfamily
MTEREFRRAFEEHKDAVYGFAYRMTGSAENAQDLTQDCFVQLLGHPGRFDPARGPLRAFLLGVTRNLVFQHWRQEKRWDVQHLDPLDEDLNGISPWTHTENGAQNGDGSLSTLVAAAVQSLAPLQREAVVLFEYEGFTLEEIAVVVGAEVGTVKSRLHRAREKLRRRLAPVRSSR